MFEPLERSVSRMRGVRPTPRELVIMAHVKIDSCGFGQNPWARDLVPWGILSFIFS